MPDPNQNPIDRSPLPADFAATCPHCGKSLDCHDKAEGMKDGGVGLEMDAQPRPGDFSVCLGCGEISRCGEHGHLLPLAPDDESDLSPEVRQVVARIQAARVCVMFSFKVAGKKWMGEKL